MTNDSIKLLDTNILVYAQNIRSPYHKKARSLLKKAWHNEVPTCVAIQNLVELFAIITDPKRTPKPLAPQEAFHLVHEYINTPTIKKIIENELTQEILLHLIQRHRPRGQEIHDVRLVALMLSWDIKTIYTADAGFKKFKEIQVMNPFE